MSVYDRHGLWPIEKLVGGDAPIVEYRQCQSWTKMQEYHLTICIPFAQSGLGGQHRCKLTSVCVEFLLFSCNNLVKSYDVGWMVGTGCFVDAMMKLGPQAYDLQLITAQSDS